jgi:tRNA G18 (ribose-2'-O)-methylase SpoU
MGRLVAETCDFKVSIPMKGKLNSLNASAAAAILLYEACASGWSRNISSESKEFRDVKRPG